MADSQTKIIISAVDATQGGLDSVRKNLSGVQSAAAAVGISLSAVGMVAFIKQNIDAADSLSKLAQKTGTTVETLAGLKFAADQNGTSLESVANAAKKLSTAMVDKPDLFAKLGITAKDSTGAMVQMADLFAAMPDGVNKTALAVKLMGKSGEEMIPFLNQGSAALREQIEQGKLYNPVTAEMAKQAELFNDQLDALKAQAGGLGMTIAGDMLPGLTQISSAMLEAARESGVLMAAIVGVGGAMKMMFTDDLLPKEQQLAKRIKSLSTEIASAEGMAGTATPTSIPLRQERGQLEAELEQLRVSGEKTRKEHEKQLKERAVFNQYMAALHIDAAQAGVYELARSGASDSDIANAQANVEHFKQLAARMGDAPKAVISEYDKLIARLKGDLVNATAAAQGAQHGYNKEQEKALALFASPEWAKMSEKQRITAAGIMEATIAQGMQAEAQKRAAELAKELVAATVANQTALHGYNKEQAKALELFLSPAWATMSEDERAAAAATLENAIAQGVQTDALEKAKKATEDAVKSNQEYMAGIGKITEDLIAKAKAAEDENALIGMSAVGIAELTARRYDEQIALKMAEADTLRGVAGREAELFLVEQQIEALGRLKNAEVARPALQAQAEDWKKFTGDIESSLTDALMRSFEAGNGFGETFVKTLENTLKSAALKVVVQAIVNPVMSGINSVAQGGSFMSGASGLANIGSAFTTGSALTSAAGGYGAFAGSSLGASLGLSELSAVASTTSAVGTQVATTLTGLGTALPYLGAALAAYSLFKDNGGTPGTNVGAAYNTYNAQGGLVGSNTHDYLSAATNQSGVNAFTDTMNANYMAAAKSLGITTASTIFSLSQNLGEDSKAPQFAIRGGAQGGSEYFSGWTAQSDAALGEAASRAVFAALQGSDLPTYLADLFDPKKHNAATMSQQDISNTLAYAGSLKQTRDALSETRTPFEILQANLTTGAAALHTTAKTYKTDFLAAINQGISPETLQSWLNLGATIDAVTAATAASTQQINDYLGANLMGDYATSTMSLTEQWQSGITTINGLTSAFDGSILAQQTLGQAVASQYQTELQLIGQIQSALDSTHATLGTTAENITLSTMTDAQRYGYYNNDISVQTALLQTATDPAVISAIVQRINNDVNSAWGILSPEQRAGAQSGFLNTLNTTDTLATQQLNAANASVISSHETIGLTITTAMDPLIIELKALCTDLKAAADTIKGAGNTMVTAADKPTKIQADINFRANVPGTSEVSIL